MGEKSEGQRLENFSSADVIAHGREARRKRRPIWTNPFTKERADLWRKGWHRTKGSVLVAGPREDGLSTKNRGRKAF
jgi:hypothetical protein